jgi:hypothetical protein
MGLVRWLQDKDMEHVRGAPEIDCTAVVAGDGVGYILRGGTISAVTRLVAPSLPSRDD